MDKKNLVLITQYFPPEIGGGANRSIGFVEGLSKLGFNITVVTPFPSYLMKKADRKIKLRLYQKIKHESFIEYRTFVIATDRGGFLRRIFYYLSFTFSSILVSIIKLKKVDTIITISPPLFTGIAGVILKRIKSSQLVFDIGDLWPESVIQLGYLKKNWIINISQKLEKWIYKRSDYINVTTPETKNWLLNRHKDLKEILYIPNFVDTNQIHKKQKSDQLLRQFNLTDKFICGYAGNIGSAQGVDIILESAKLTKDNNQIIYFIIGDGVEKEFIEHKINIEKIENLILLPPISKNQLNDYIALFDLQIIPLVQKKLFTMTVPSKLYESMSAEIPVIICVDGEARKIVERHNCGFYVQPEDHKALAETIVKIYKNKNSLNDLGANGRKAAVKYFSKEKVILDLFNHIN